ncbi:outer membrane protein [Labrys neptuniae]
MKFRLALLLATAFSTPVLAADLAPKSVDPVPPVPAAFSWTGFYVGGHLGGIWNGGNLDSRATTVAFFDKSAVVSRSGFHSDPGVISGVQAGYNYQIDQFVLGIEGNVDLTSGHNNYTVNGNTLNPFPFQLPFNETATTSLKDSSRWAASLRARFGYAFGQWLPYVTAGVGVRQDKLSGTTIFAPFGGTSSVSDTKTQVGFVGGAGLEYALNEHWSVRGEVLYSWYPKHKLRFDNADTATSSVVSSKPRTIAATVGVNYRF